MTLRNEILLVTNAAQYVASPADSAGASPTVESPVTGALTIPIAVSGDDVDAHWGSTSWVFPGAFGITPFVAGTTVHCAKTKSGPDYDWQGIWLRFDTSSIPDNATITAASLDLYATAKTDGANNYNLVADYYDFGGDALVIGDCIETSSPAILTADLGAITLSAVNTFTITDLTGISKTGITGIRLTLSSGTPTVTNEVWFAASEHATAQEPRLTVTYTIPATQVDAWLTANGQATGLPWGPAFALAVYRNLNLDPQVGSAISPEAIWRQAYALNLISPTPLRGCMALIVRLNAAGLLDESNIPSTSKVGIYCRRHENANQLLLIAGNELLDSGVTDGVVLRFFDAAIPVPTDPTLSFVFVVPSCVTTPSVGLRAA